MSWVGSPLPAWRRLLALAGNSVRLVVLGGLRSWRRDLRLVMPALGSMTLLLLLCGALALAFLAAYQVTVREAGQVSMVRVYLAATATPEEIASLRARLAGDGRVSAVREVTREEALRSARERPGLAQLASLSADNPFPASLDVQVRRVTDVASVASSAIGDRAVDPSYPTSYDPAAYAGLRRVALGVGAVAALLLGLFLVMAYSVFANSMRSIAAARRDEVALMRLLAARGWMMRGPFVMEGLATGAFAGALAGGLVGAAWIVAGRFSAALYAQLLPGVGPASVRYVVAGLMVAGLSLGSLTAMLGFRRVGA